jgi:hypothetical protein
VLAAGKLSTVLDRLVADPRRIDARQQFLLLAYSCFGVSERGGKKHRLSLATKLTRCCLIICHTGQLMSHSTGIIFITQEENRVDRFWDAELGGACGGQD